jgi:hypothetical protein
VDPGNSEASGELLDALAASAGSRHYRGVASVVDIPQESNRDATGADDPPANFVGRHSISFWSGRSAARDDFGGYF